MQGIKVIIFVKGNQCFVVMGTESVGQANLTSGNFKHNSIDVEQSIAVM
jgi:hypothetical protein